MKESKPIWWEKGPAEKLYHHFLQQPSLRDAWVEMLRKSWGNPHHPDLALFPEIKEQRRVIPNSIDGEVTITEFIPPETGPDLFIYLHGGGWMSPLSGKHRAWAKKIAHMTKMRVLCVHYRLSPENPFPAALKDCVTVYQHVREKGSKRVFVGGDSSGGNLSAALGLFCHDHSLQKPDKILCLCPMTDMSFENYPSIQQFGIGNPVADMSLIAFQRFCYVPYRRDWEDPYVSPVLGSLATLPPTLVLVAMDDPLRDDNLAFAQKLKEAGVPTELLTYEKMPHAFYTYPQYLPTEADQANKKISKFLLI